VSVLRRARLVRDKASGATGGGTALTFGPFRCECGDADRLPFAAGRGIVRLHGLRAASVIRGWGARWRRGGGGRRWRRRAGVLLPGRSSVRRVSRSEGRLGAGSTSSLFGPLFALAMPSYEACGRDAVVARTDVQDPAAFEGGVDRVIDDLGGRGPFEVLVSAAPDGIDDQWRGGTPFSHGPLFSGRRSLFRPCVDRVRRALAVHAGDGDVLLVRDEPAVLLGRDVGRGIDGAHRARRTCLDRAGDRVHGAHAIGQRRATATAAAAPDPEGAVRGRVARDVDGARQALAATRAGDGRDFRIGGGVLPAVTAAAARARGASAVRTLCARVVSSTGYDGGGSAPARSTCAR